MSVEATNWVLNDAPNVPPHLVSTLFGLANHAHADGRNAYISKETLSRYTRKAPRNVQKDLRDLEELGLIVLGDQRVVEHYRADKRPTVYNLAVWLKRDGEMPTSSRSNERGDAERQAGRCTVSSGGMQASPKPKEEPKEEPKSNSTAPSSLARSSRTPQSRAAQTARPTQGGQADTESDDAILARELGPMASDEQQVAYAMLANGANVWAAVNTVKKLRREGWAA